MCVCVCVCVYAYVCVCVYYIVALNLEQDPKTVDQAMEKVDILEYSTFSIGSILIAKWFDSWCNLCLEEKYK